jgi:hypothetical protein
MLFYFIFQKKKKKSNDNFLIGKNNSGTCMGSNIYPHSPPPISVGSNLFQKPCSSDANNNDDNTNELVKMMMYLIEKLSDVKSVEK